MRIRLMGQRDGVQEVSELLKLVNPAAEWEEE